MIFPQTTLVSGLSGDRFRVIYRIAGDEARVMAAAREICLDQTVELPADIVPNGHINDFIVGQIEDAQQHEYYGVVTINYAVETAGTGLSQLLNVIFGSTSMLPGVQVMHLDLAGRILVEYKGPRFGIAGLRKLFKVEGRPLLCTALKPMGLGAEELAEIAYRMARSGIDIIKDDHGLANQPFCPYEARVWRCAQAVAKANRETGMNCIYVPNVTAPVDQVIERALFAKRAGAGALLICYGLTGIDAMRMLADDNRVHLPIMAHPAFFGSFVVTPTSGLSYYTLYGQIMRLAGADASIFVNYGGRYPFTPDQCRDAIDGCTESMGHFPAIFPVAGGGIAIEQLPELREFYGRDVVFLMAGGLYRNHDDLATSVQMFMQKVRE